MIVTTNISRAALRTAAILLAAGIVVAATSAITPPYDQTREQAAEAEQAQKHAATPGGEDALRRVIDDIQRGQPDYARMAPRLSGRVHSLMPYARSLLEYLGPLQSLTYAGPFGRGDFYRATYRNGSVRWAIVIDKNGGIEDLGFGPISPPNPHRWIDSYAAYSTGDGAQEIAVRLVQFLALAAFGRLALRLRL